MIRRKLPAGVYAQMVDASHLAPIDEFFMISQPPPGEICDDEEREIARTLNVKHDPLEWLTGCYERREDAEAVCAELNRRKPERRFTVVSSKDVP